MIVLIPQTVKTSIYSLKNVKLKSDKKEKLIMKNLFLKIIEN